MLPGGCSTGGSTSCNSSSIGLELVKASRSSAKEGTPRPSTGWVWSTSESNHGEEETYKVAAGSGVRDTCGAWTEAVVRAESSTSSTMTTLEMFSEGRSSGQAERPSGGRNRCSKLSAYKDTRENT